MEKLHSGEMNINQSFDRLRIKNIQKRFTWNENEISVQLAAIGGKIKRYMRKLREICNA